jgi:hypothetical protein
MGKRGRTGELLRGRKKEKSNSWKGGRVISRGYMTIYCDKNSPYFPMARRKSKSNDTWYILEHRLVMAQHLRRLLTNNEIVHHINGNKTDNRIENLVITTRAAHLIHHGIPRIGGLALMNTLSHEQRRMRGLYGAFVRWGTQP